MLNNFLPTDTTKYDLRAEQRRTYILGCISNGARMCITHPRYLLAVLAYSLIVAAIFLFRATICKALYAPPINGVMLVLFPFVLFFIATFLGFIALYAMGTTKNACQYYRNFVRAGITNNSGEAPLLIASEKALTHPSTFLTFTTHGLPLETWIDKQSTIESALNIIIINSQYGANRRTIRLTVLSGDKTLPDYIEWDWSYLPNEKNTLALGESVTGAVTVNLKDTPHLLIAGSTGSGKSILIKAIVAQCLAHDDCVILCDLKGLDFNTFHWMTTKIEVLTDVTAVKNMLIHVTDELHKRAKDAQRFYADPLNKDKQLPPVQSIRICIDEITALTDKTALDKDGKAEIDSILRSLTLIATQGRAFNITLILSTQRPDVDAIPGKIKANIDGRICGRADNTLSLIVLDNADANDRIPKDSHGLFLTNMGTLFKGYYFTDSMLDNPIVPNF